MLVLSILLFSPSSLRAQVDTTWAMDLDVSPGDQGVRALNAIRPEQEVPVDLVAKHRVQTTIGAEVVFTFDSTKVDVLTFKSVGRAGFQPYGPRLVREGTFTFAFVSLFPVELGSGSLARATFKTLPDFSGETEIVLVRAQFGDGDTFSNLISEPDVSVVIRSTGERSPDFNGNGGVDFEDFLAFAQNFGREEGDVDFNIRFDLNADGAVDFKDFVLFARSYG